MAKYYFARKISQEQKNSTFCFSYVFVLMICYFEQNFVEIRFLESVFFNFRGIAQSQRRKIIKMATILKEYTKTFFADNHKVWRTLSMVQFLSGNSTGKVVF